MCPLNNTNWEQADSTHRITLILETEAGKKASEEESEKLRALEPKSIEQAIGIGLLKRINRDQFEKLERSEKEIEKLNIEKKEDIPELDCVALVRYRNAFIGLFDTANKSMIAALEGGGGGEKQKLKKISRMNW